MMENKPVIFLTLLLLLKRYKNNINDFYEIESKKISEFNP